MSKKQTPTQHAASILNAFHTKYCAGFYGASIGGRYFAARAVGDVLEVSPDFGETWRAVPLDTKFISQAGREIITRFNA